MRISDWSSDVCSSDLEEPSTVAQECVWLFDVFQDFSGDDGVEPSAGKSLHHLAGIACHAFVVVVRKRAPIEVKADHVIVGEERVRRLRPSYIEHRAAALDKLGPALHPQ